MAPTKRERPEVEAPAADEELFPRGRSSVLTPLEERKLKLKAKADFEKEASLSTRPAKRNKRSAQKGASAGGTKGDDEVRTSRLIRGDILQLSILFVRG